MTSRSNTWLVILFLLWLSLLAGAYWYFLIKPKRWFDNTMQQPPIIAELSQQAAIRQMLRHHVPQLNSGQAWFVRLKQSHCACERFVELYHQGFVGRYSHLPVQVASLDLAYGQYSESERKLLNRLIPSTPSVLLFDANANLLYFGPYHQTGICSAENSFLEPVLNAFQNGEFLSVLNTLVYGCFCSVEL